MTPHPPCVRIEDLADYEGQKVRIQGWLYNQRSSGKLKFLQLRDGSGFVQAVVFKKNVSPEIWESLADLSQESALEIVGTAKADERAPFCGHELSVSDVILGAPSEPYPLGKKDHGPHFLHEHRHLWLRSRRPFAILRIRHTIIRAIHQFFDERGFVQMDSPLLTPNACEGTSTLFETPYFGGTAYLSQSGQLYQEATAMAMGRTYCFGPTFRAEKSKTRRHLTEFWMVEPEMAYADLDDIMDMEEDFIVAIVQKVLADRRPELEILERDLSKLESIQRPFPRMSYDEACQRLAELGKPVDAEDDFGAEHETLLSQGLDRPILVHRYPSAVKAFYMKRDPQRPDRALGVDMIAPEGVGEIIGGGQREEDLEALRQRIDEHGLPQEAFAWYLDLRRYGSVPHGGFGLGLERTVAWICGVHHVREVIPFPRTLERLTP